MYEIDSYVPRSIEHNEAMRRAATRFERHPNVVASVLIGCIVVGVFAGVFGGAQHVLAVSVVGLVLLVFGIGAVLTLVMSYRPSWAPLTAAQLEQLKVMADEDESVGAALRSWGRTAEQLSQRDYAACVAQASETKVQEERKDAGKKLDGVMRPRASGAGAGDPD